MYNSALGLDSVTLTRTVCVPLRLSDVVAAVLVIGAVVLGSLAFWLANRTVSNSSTRPWYAHTPRGELVYAGDFT